MSRRFLQADSAGVVQGDSDGRVICNPLDLNYRYQDIRVKQMGRSVNREAADPSIVRYQGRFYLFASMSHGFWHSPDLVDWRFQWTDKLPPFDYAPDVREIRGALYISASRKNEPCPIFRSVDPLLDDFEVATPGTFEFWDPNLFEDEDGRTYLYWGCGNRAPLYGRRLDPESLAPLDDPVELLRSDSEKRGWERIGENHEIQPPKTEFERQLALHRGDMPFIEGAWMTHHDGTYYLQYAAPGTEYNTYADGYYTAESPLGPFRYSPHSPFSYKPGGFIAGAGHGSTFQDQYGNWWHASTMRISVNHSFERRVGLFPAGFDDDGVLFCNQNFADYPMRVPARRFDPWTEASPSWMLLSYKTPITASSSLEAHGPELAVNEDIQTWWVAGSNEPGEWLQVDLGRLKSVHAIQVNLADHELENRAPETPENKDFGWQSRGMFSDWQSAEILVEVSGDGERWKAVLDTRGREQDSPHAFVVLDRPERARYVRATSDRLPFDAAFAVSGLRVFGVGDGSPPEAVKPRGVRIDGRAARLEWDGGDGAQGYNARFGLAPDKLYSSWLVYEQTDLTVRSLNAGHDYWFAIDAFNENGVTAGEPIRIAAPAERSAQRSGEAAGR